MEKFAKFKFEVSELVVGSCKQDISAVAYKYEGSFRKDFNLSLWGG